MEINLENYEAYIIDYLDNQLDPVQTAELLLFMENNPQLKEDLEALKDVTVTASSKEEFGFKEMLIQPFDKDALQLTADNYSHYFIAQLEGDLSAAGNKKVDQFLKAHPELKSDYKLFASCRLQPEKRVKFPKPEQLKVNTKRAFISYYLATGIAASILLLATVYFRFTPETNESIDNTLRNAVEQQMLNDKSPIIDSEKKENTNKNDRPLEKSENPKPVIKKAATKPAPVIKKENNISTPVRKVERKGIMMNTTPMMSDAGLRTFYSGLYEDIRLSQELALSNLEEQEEIKEMQEAEKAEKIRGVKAGRIINSVISSGEQLAEQIPQSMNGWLFADMGIKGFNILTNNNYSIDRRYSSKGAIKQLKIEEKKL